MLTFDDRTGPDLGDDAPAYPDSHVPDWWRDAKLGFFIHLGIYSLPGWAVTEDAPPGRDYAWHHYAEWYANTVRIPDSPTRRHHERTFGVGTSYEDLADLWTMDGFDASHLVGEIAATGAGYLIPTTKHHDGFCLWDTATTGFTSVQRGPHRDLVAELHDATVATGMRFGAYFSGALDWHVSDFPPITSNRDLFELRRNDEAFARHAARQLTELVDRFHPAVLWNDIDWPDAGKGRDDFGLARLFEHHAATVPDGVVNDRWGVPHRGFATREYHDVPALLDQPWEATRGLGLSFGYNRNETADQTMTGADLIRLLVDVVAKNGNLLVNIGPRADGSIPDLQLAAMRDLGTWMAQHRQAVVGTCPWGPGVRGDQRLVQRDDTVYVHLLRGDRLDLPPELARRRVEWIGSSQTGPTRPAALAGLPVAVARLV